MTVCLQIHVTLQSSGSSRIVTAYRGKVEQLVVWCIQNNLELNILKPVQMTVDFKKNPQHIPCSPVKSFRFLLSTISDDLKWETYIYSILEKSLTDNALLPPVKLHLPQDLLICSHH